MKQSSMHVIIVPEGERRKSGAKEVFEYILAKNFSKLIKYIIIYPRCLENTN